MIPTLDIIERLPGELAARLEADEYFADIPVIVADEGNVRAMVEKKQGALTSKTGKSGVAVIVLQILGDDDYANLAFGPMTLRPAFQVVEQREMNIGPSGTGKSARQVARRIRDVIKCCQLEGLVTDMQADRPCIEPVNLASEQGKNIVSFQVNFACKEIPSEVLSQVQLPVIAQYGGGAQFQITCATAGADLWWTQDDSYPQPNNSAAKVYTSPIDIPNGGLVVRACAFKAGMLASIVIRKTITGVWS
jgi:hypothetical protein